MREVRGLLLPGWTGVVSRGTDGSGAWQGACGIVVGRSNRWGSQGHVPVSVWGGIRVWGLTQKPPCLPLLAFYAQAGLGGRHWTWS